MSSINVLLEKADLQYRLLHNHKYTLDNLLVSITDHSNERPDDVGGPTGTTSGPAAGTTSAATGSQAASGAGQGSTTSAINKNIQMLAQKYCGDCRTAFEELSKIIQVNGLHPCILYLDSTK